MLTALTALLLAGGLVSDAEAGTTFRKVQGTFELSYDPRDCVWPLCGGYWITPVNHDRMVCEDGQIATACYIAEVDWDALGWDAQDVSDYLTAVDGGPLVIRGRLQRVTYPQGPWVLGVLTPRVPFVAWEPPPRP